MEKDVQESPTGVERRLSYCEINAKEPGSPRLGAGDPGKILELQDDGPNIRFFMLDPLDGIPWRAYYSEADIREDGKLIRRPPIHASQAQGAWMGFYFPLTMLTVTIAKRILAGRFHEEDPLGGNPVWLCVRPAGLTIAPIPGPPALETLLEGREEARWWPLYIRLHGDAEPLRRVLDGLSSEDEAEPIKGGER